MSLSAQIVPSSATPLPNSRGKERNRIQFRAFPDDNVYRIGVSRLGNEKRVIPPHLLTFRNPFERGFWNRSWVPIQVECEDVQETVLIDVTSLSRRIRIAEDEILKRHEDNQLPQLLRRKGLELSIPSLSKDEIDSIEDQREIEGESLVTRRFVQQDCQMVAIQEWMNSDRGPELIERIWNYTKGGFVALDKELTPISAYLERLPFHQAPSLSQKKRGLTQDDFETIYDSIRTHYPAAQAEILATKQPKLIDLELPNRSHCTLRFQRNGTILVEWRAYIPSLDGRVDIIDYTWDYLSLKLNRNDRNNHKTVQQKIKKYLKERSAQIAHIFAKNRHLFGLIERAANELSEVIRQNYQDGNRDITLISNGLEIDFKRNGRVFVKTPHSPHIVIDENSKLPRVCRNCTQAWDYFADQYTTNSTHFLQLPENQFLIQENLLQGWMALKDAAKINSYLLLKYDEHASQALREPGTVRARGASLPCNLYFKSDGHVYAKIKKKKYPSGATKKAKDAISLFTGVRMKRLVANLESMDSIGHSQEVALLRKEFRILAAMGKTRGVVEVFDLIEGRNKRGERTLTLYERDYRLGGADSKIAFSDAQKWVIAADFLHGLQKIHRDRILHRDLKLQNLVIDTPDIHFTKKSPVESAIADFNLALEVESESSIIGIGGTLPYMSPEKARAWKTNATDWTVASERMAEMWAVGVVLYQIFIDDWKTTYENLLKITEQKQFLFKPKTKGPLESFILQLLQVEPKNRMTIDRAVDQFERIRPKDTFWSTMWNKPKQDPEEQKGSEAVSHFTLEAPHLLESHFS